MTAQQHIIGFVSIDGRYPGFRFPVFDDAGGTGRYRVQMIGDDDRIVAFVSAGVDPNVIETCASTMPVSVRVGDRALFAFAFGKEDIVVGTKDEVAAELRTRADAAEKGNAFARYQIARFVGHIDRKPFSLGAPQEPHRQMASDRGVTEASAARIQTADRVTVRRVAEISSSSADEAPAIHLFAEMVGAPAASQSRGPGPLSGVPDMRAIRPVLDATVAYGGHVLDMAPDRVLTSFHTTHDAGECAVHIQRKMTGQDATTSVAGHAGFRIGISAMTRRHVDSTTTAHEVSAVAPPGGICMSDAVYKDVQNSEWAGPARWEIIRSPDRREPVRLFTLQSVADRTPTRPIDDARTENRKHLTINAAEPRVAVGAFSSQIGDHAGAAICDGIRDDLVTGLSRFPELIVIARHATPGADQSITRTDFAGPALDVRYLLTGRLRRSRDKIYIDVQLVATDSHAVLWSMRHDGNPEDEFQFQDEVTNTASGQIVGRICAAERHIAQAVSRNDLSAYWMVLRGEQVMLRHSKLANQHARHLFEQAAIREPAYARPYAGLARSFSLDWQFGWADDPQTALEVALEMSDRAIQNDHTNPRGYAERARALLYQRRHEAAFAACERSLELNPNDPDILVEFANLHTYGSQAGAAVALIEEAMKLNPYYPDFYLVALGEAHFCLGNFSTAIGYLLRVRDSTEADRTICAAYAHLGQMEEAHLYAERIRSRSPGFSVADAIDPLPYKDPDAKDQFIEGMRKAGLE